MSEVDGETRYHLSWDEVRTIFAYNHDCFAFDQMRVILSGEAVGIEFTEDDFNFSGLCTTINKRLAIHDDWYARLQCAPPSGLRWVQVYVAEASVAASSVSMPLNSCEDRN